MATYDLGKVVGDAGPKGDKGDTGETGNGIQSIILRSTVGKVKTYRITYTNGDTFDFQVTDGEDGSSSEVEIVTSWNNTLSDEKVPSEKLSKNTLDGKAPTSHASSSSTYGLGSTSNYGHVKTVNGLTQSSHSDGTALSAYQGKVLKDAIDAKPDSSDIPTKTSDLTNDSNYISTSSTSGLIKNDGTIDTTSYSTFSGSYNDLTNKPTIPSKTSDLTNDGADGTNVFVANNDSRLSDARTPTSHTHGNLTNDGKVGSTANYFVYTTTSGAITSKQKIGNITTSGAIGSTANKPLITTTNGVITTGSFGTTENTFCQGNDSRLSDARTPTAHTHTVSNITDFPTLSTVATSGSYNDLSNKPTIPSSLADLSGGSLVYSNNKVSYNTGELATLSDIPSLTNYVQKSSTSGLIKNDGTIDTSAYITSSALSNYVQKSNTSGLIKNDGTIDTSAYITSSAISGMLTSSDIVDNLTTNDATKVLSAKQGKALKDLIGDAITYINGTGS